MVRNQGRVTRFVVMAVLQAARALTLGLPEESAFSWGLNRAIFIAAAKRGFKQGSSTADGTSAGTPSKTEPQVYRLGDDEAYRDPKSSRLIFRIGDKDQTGAEFKKSVIARFGTEENFRLAWKEAIEVVGRFDHGTLASRERFYEEVYRPRRDELSDEWSRKYSPPLKKK
jgi:hypothetical protein